MNLENTNIESITQQDPVNKFVTIIISYGFLVVFFNFPNSGKGITSINHNNSFLFHH